MEDTEFKKVEKFKHLSSLVTEDNIVAQEIKERISAGNKCYLSLKGMFQGKNISRATKIRLYKTVSQWSCTGPKLVQ